MTAVRLQCSSELLVTLYQTTRRHISEDGCFQKHGYDKLKLNIK